MVDWDRVEELRSKGVGWDKIAADAKVGFHADSSAGDPGRALRALYHRNRSRVRSKGGTAGSTKPDASAANGPSGWGLLRVFYLLTPLIAVWALLSYLVPSPIGLVVPAIPYLALVAAVVAAALLLLIMRTSPGARWSKLFRSSLIYGVVLGLVLSALIGLTGSLAFGCPLLPPTSSLGSVPNSGWSLGSGSSRIAVDPWQTVPTASWQSGGKPVFYSYGTTWCPFCSASSWAEWKALKAFGQVGGESFGYSSSSDVYPSTPEVILAGLTIDPMGGHAPAVAWQVSEDTSGNRANFPPTASCTEQAYVQAYGSGIPFVVLNGQTMHIGTLVLPQNLSAWAGGANGGTTNVSNSVLSESGAAWNSISFSAWWLMAFLAKASGVPVTTLASDYGWTIADRTHVTNDLALM